MYATRKNSMKNSTEYFIYLTAEWVQEWVPEYRKYGTPHCESVIFDNSSQIWIYKFKKCVGK